MAFTIGMDIMRQSGMFIRALFLDEFYAFPTPQLSNLMLQLDLEDLLVSSCIDYLQLHIKPRSQANL